MQSQAWKGGQALASITIRNLDEDLKQRLRIRAAEHGHSMEQEARNILAAALAREPQTGAELLRSNFAPRSRTSASSNQANWRCHRAARCVSLRDSSERARSAILDANVVSHLVRSALAPRVPDRVGRSAKLLAVVAVQSQR